MNELTPIIISVANAVLIIALPAVAVAVVGALVVWSRKTWAQFKASQPTVAEQLAFYVRIAVEAAEQAGLGKLVTDKKAYALAIARQWLFSVGLQNIQIELIEAEIERQVREMKQPGSNKTFPVTLFQ
jgi:hypothetical protein